MCGIAGIALWKKSVSQDALTRATDSLRHRGPDDGGTEIILTREGQAEVGLGNRRLAIIDLSAAGHQPMTDSQNGNRIVYNGELYNFRSLRAELESMGTNFVTRTDTEVLLKAYGKWGEQCLDRLRGMFAFAIWDAGRQRLFLARDPLGIKPLYYSCDEQQLVFASEVRAVLASGLVPRRLSPGGLATYLSFGSVYDPMTLIEGVQALPAGHWLSWQDANLEICRYWQPPDVTAGSGDTGESALPALLDSTIEAHTVSDVPLGVFLSGGIDSSALVGLLSRHGKVSTFSVVFREAEYNEAPFSRAVAERFHTDHHELEFSADDARASLQDVVHAMDQPTMDGVNSYFVARAAARAGLKVAMSGLGGDELFAGYHTFIRVPKMDDFERWWGRLPHVVRAAAAAIVGAVGSASDRKRKLLALIGNDGIDPYFLSRMLFLPSQRIPMMNGAATAAASSMPSKLMEESLAGAPQDDDINRISYLELRNYMLNTLLRDVDCMSMAHSLEVRVPFVDRDLVNAMFRVPGNRKIDRQTPKCLLVRTLGDLLPPEVVFRQKRGFALPLNEWMRGSLRAEVESTLNAIEDGPLQGWLHPGAVRDVYQQFLKGSVSWSRPWALYTLARWCQSHIA